MKTCFSNLYLTYNLAYSTSTVLKVYYLLKLGVWPWHHLITFQKFTQSKTQQIKRMQNILKLQLWTINLHSLLVVQTVLVSLLYQMSGFVFLSIKHVCAIIFQTIYQGGTMAVNHSSHILLQKMGLGPLEMKPFSSECLSVAIRNRPNKNLWSLISFHLDTFALSMFYPLHCFMLIQHCWSFWR